MENPLKYSNRSFKTEHAASKNLQNVAQGQKQAIQGVSSFIPTPMTQFAAGLNRGVDSAAASGGTMKEGVTRGLVSGIGGAALSVPIIPALKGAYNKAKGIGSEAMEGGAMSAVTGGNKKVNTLAEKIQPQLNNREKELAMADNRFISGDQGRFFGKKEATILPSQEVTQAARTVYSEIPGAHKMKPEQLKVATEKRVAKISQELRPELDKIPLDESVKENMLNNYLKLKEELMADVNFKKRASGGDLLQTFEDKFLMPAMDRGNLGELWDDAIKLDQNPTLASKSIKNATEMSEQYLKDQQNAYFGLRNILRDSIKQADGTIKSKAVRDKFQRLRDLLLTKENLIKKAPHEFKAKPGILSKRNIYGGIASTAGLGVAYNMLGGGGSSGN